jgi:hydrogenase expression/formation protein HypE
VLDIPGDGGRLAFTTDAFVVRPLFFPGGNIGDLAVHGTVNDLAVGGARPLAISAAFVLEEGLPMPSLAKIVEAMADAARAVGVPVATGDTKVVERGRGDGCYITTTGVGWVPPGVSLHPTLVRPGDSVLVSGPVGRHGVAVMSFREGLGFEADVVSDSAPLNELVSEMLGTEAEIHALRDPTRGGVAATLCEIAGQAEVGIEVHEESIPVPEAVRAACEMLGLDPLYVANEGILVAFVSPEGSDEVLSRMREHPLGAEARKIGSVVADHPGTVLMRTPIGGSRIVDVPLGEQLPRIC